MHALHSYKTLRAIPALLFSGDTGSTTRENAGRENKEDERGGIGRVDRNKRSDVTRDKAAEDCARKVALQAKQGMASSENNGAREERKDSCQGVEKRASRRTHSRSRRLGWLLSRERNCGCLSNPTDRNSISSCVSHLPRAAFPPYPPTGYHRLAPSRPSPPLALGPSSVAFSR